MKYTRKELEKMSIEKLKKLKYKAGSDFVKSYIFEKLIFICRIFGKIKSVFYQGANYPYITCEYSCFDVKIIIGYYGHSQDMYTAMIDVIEIFTNETKIFHASMNEKIDINIHTFIVYNWPISDMDTLYKKALEQKKIHDNLKCKTEKEKLINEMVY